jgi:hypothetical protein
VDLAFQEEYGLESDRWLCVACGAKGESIAMNFAARHKPPVNPAAVALAIIIALLLACILSSN